jgi:hypothetical protein
MSQYELFTFIFDSSDKQYISEQRKKGVPLATGQFMKNRTVFFYSVFCFFLGHCQKEIPRLFCQIIS